MANKIKTAEIFKDALTGALTEEEYKQIESMLKEFKKDKDIELEVSFRNVDYANFMRISTHYVDIVDEKNISNSNSLDISIMLKDGNTYRVSIMDADKINSFIQNFMKSKTIDVQKYLLTLDPSEDYEIMFKDRGSANRLYVDNFAMVFKTTIETPLGKSKKPQLNGTEKMLYRYKDRYGFVINDNIRIDITNVQESSDIWSLTKKASNYEIEIEFINRKISTDNFFEEVSSVISVVQDSEIPIGKKEAQMVIQKYGKMLELRTIGQLESRNVISIEAQHIVKFIPNKYAITDKADGERYFLINIEEGMYLLSANMRVKKILLRCIGKKNHDMILDGELIINDYGRMYLAFDVVYANGVDYRYNEKYTLPNVLMY